MIKLFKLLIVIIALSNICYADSAIRIKLAVFDNPKSDISLVNTSGELEDA